MSLHVVLHVRVEGKRDREREDGGGGGLRRLLSLFFFCLCNPHISQSVALFPWLSAEID